MSVSDRAAARTLVPEHRDALSMFRATVRRAADDVMIGYFDAELTFGEVDRISSALAAALRDAGFLPGDRLGVVAQNIPHVVAVVLATWKAGGIVVPMNPMLSDRELEFVCRDAEVSALACEESRVGEWTKAAALVAPVISMCPHEFQTEDDRRVLPPHTPRQEGSVDLTDLVAGWAGPPTNEHTPAPADPATIVYTSGTTGRPKGAVNRHESIAFVGQVYRDWLGLTPEDRILGVSPLSTIIGVAVGLATTFLTGCRYHLMYRFDLGVALDALRSRQPTFLVGVPTLFTALLGAEELTAEDTASLRHVYSGGAPLPPALASRWLERFGRPLRTVYGMTEATGPTHLSPVGEQIPVDADTGALSIGVPVFDTDCRVVDPEGSVHDEVADGVVGEMVVRGPQTVREYWRNPQATATGIPDGWVRTGDLAVRRGEWLFIVDRLKDIIITSGNNVSPTQVEDCLLTHPAVREVSVIGVPDEYRGEAVHAVVVPAAGARIDADGLIAFAREHLAAYKCPRTVEFADALPKNATGKVLRRELRDRTIGARAAT